MPGSVLKTLHIDLIGVGRCCFMKVEAGSGREHTDQPKSHSWSVLALRLESSVSDSGTPAFSVTGLRHCPGTASGLSLGRTAELGTSSPRPGSQPPPQGSAGVAPRGLAWAPQQQPQQRLCTILSQGQRVPGGHRECGLGPASWKSPWPPSSPPSSFPRQSLPNKQEGGPQACRPPALASSSSPTPQSSLPHWGAHPLHTLISVRYWLSLQVWVGGLDSCCLACSSSPLTRQKSPLPRGLLLLGHSPISPLHSH